MRVASEIGVTAYDWNLTRWRQQRFPGCYRSELRLELVHARGGLELHVHGLLVWRQPGSLRQHKICYRIAVPIERQTRVASPWQTRQNVLPLAEACNAPLLLPSSPYGVPLPAAIALHDLGMPQRKRRAQGRGPEARRAKPVYAAERETVAQSRSYASAVPRFVGIASTRRPGTPRGDAVVGHNAPIRVLHFEEQVRDVCMSCMHAPLLAATSLDALSAQMLHPEEYERDARAADASEVCCKCDRAMRHRSRYAWHAPHPPSAKARARRRRAAAANAQPHFDVAFGKMRGFTALGYGSPVHMIRVELRCRTADCRAACPSCCHGTWRTSSSGSGHRSAS